MCAYKYFIVSTLYNKVNIISSVLNEKVLNFQGSKQIYFFDNTRAYKK